MVSPEDNGTVELPRGKIVGGNWLVVRKLGEGGCGSVYYVKSMEDDSEAAMKAESNFAAGGCVLKLEVAILKRLVGKPHVCHMICAARVTNFSYVIMTLLGDSLNRIAKNLGKAFTVSSQVRIAINTLFCLKQIHDIGFIHRDLKPANMALGRANSNESRFLHVLDFGLARQYAVPSTTNPDKYLMRRPRDRALFRGTTRYCSIRMHDRSEQGRVDDLWSMVYLLAELRGLLPWSQQNDKRVVGEMKRIHSDEVVLQNSPLEFLEIAQHLRSLTYYHRPDYFKMFMLLIQVMEKGGFKWEDPFDWEIKPLGAKTPTVTPTRSPIRSPAKIARSISTSIIKRSPKKAKESVMSKEPHTSVAGSKEVVVTSKEKTNKSAEPTMSNETVDAPPSKGLLSPERRAEIMQIVPFDPEFFITDPIGF